MTDAHVCEQTAPSRYTNVERPGVERTTPHARFSAAPGNGTCVVITHDLAHIFIMPVTSNYSQQQKLTSSGTGHAVKLKMDSVQHYQLLQF